jgi:hypothetical protein
MSTIADKLLAATPVGVIAALPSAGTALENRFVYDSVAHDIKQHAKSGRVEIVAEDSVDAGSEVLIRHLEFRRLR